MIQAPDRRQGLGSDTRGAVLVEFLVALMPLMITFFSFVQIGQIATARIVMKHANVVGARAAAVIANGHHNTPDQPKGDNKLEIETAIAVALGPWAQTMDTMKVDVDDKSSCDDPYGPVKVKVEAEYKCSVPFGSFLLCARNRGHYTIKTQYTFPHQGARYKDGGGASCEEGHGGGGH